MTYQEEMEINIMAIDATFWVAVSFVIFFGALIYLKIPQKITQILDKMISDIKNVSFSTNALLLKFGFN